MTAPGGFDGVPPVAADGEWHRVHPMTPAVRSWQAIAVLLVVITQELGQSMVRGEGHTPAEWLGQLHGQVLAGGGLVAVAVLTAVVTSLYLSWRFTSYRVTHDALELRHGVLSRRLRQAPLDRLQAVDVVQPVLARIFGLARLTLEVAGGDQGRIELAYLTQTQARRLRNHLLAGAAGVRYTTAEAPEAPEHLVFTVPLERLAGSLALSVVSLVLVVGVLVVLVASLATRSLEFGAGLLPTVLAVGTVLWHRFGVGFGFRVATSPDGLRLQHGLLEQRTQTVPPGRVQAVRLRQPLLWRPAGWWRVEVNVAGYAGMRKSGGHEQSAVLLPVGTRDEAVTVLSFVIPDLGVGAEHPGVVVDAGLTGSHSSGGFTCSPARARWVDPIGWRRNGFRVTSQVLLLRRGVLHRQLDVVPHARTQSCGVRQGPLQRRLRVASFALHSTPGPVSAVVHHLASPVAAGLLQAQVRRARLARAGAGPERWMERSAPPGSAPPGSAAGALRQPPEPAE